LFHVVTEENEERMMIDPTSREDPKVKELLQVCILHHYHIVGALCMTGISTSGYGTIHQCNVMSV